MTTDALERNPLHRSPTLMTTEQLCAYLQVSRRTLTSWREQHTGPPYVRVGATIRYRPDDVDAWLGRFTVTPLHAR